jgi:hypothetical protein
MAGFARGALGVAVGCTALMGVGTGVAHAAPYSCTGQAPQQALSTETPQPGDTVTDQLSCFAASETVTGLFFSTPQHLFTVQTDAAGSATVTFQVPDACGEHTVVARGAAGDHAATTITVAGECRHRNHHHGARRDRDCGDWRDPGFWIHNCDTADDGWDTGFDAAYTAPLPAHHSSNTTMAGVVGLVLLTPALIGGGLVIARRRSSR